MKTINNFKRGDTFTLTCKYKVGGVATSVNNIDIKSQIRNNSGKLIASLTVVKTANVGEFILNLSASNTALFPISVLSCDIEFYEGGSIRSSDTFNIVVIDDVTK